ncbi:NPC intracellular cholesterol transporter 2, partial [Caerostris extrusa]
GVVKSVSVEPCNKEPCEIPKGQSAVISVHCVSNTNAEKLRLSVWAEIAGVELPYPGMKRDACNGKNVTCPIKENVDLHYTQTFQVKKFFPSVQTTARFNLKTNDDQDKVICCFKAPVKVV